MAYKDKIKQREYYKKKLKTNNCIDCGISIWNVSIRCVKCSNKRMVGELHSGWKGGRNIDGYGYIKIYKPNHPFANNLNYVMEHRWVMESHLGRYLKPEERVHHIDGDKTNNVIENLHLFPNESKHQEYHWFLRRYVKGMLAL